VIDWADALVGAGFRAPSEFHPVGAVAGSPRSMNRLRSELVDNPKLYGSVTMLVSTFAVSGTYTRTLNR